MPPLSYKLSVSDKRCLSFQRHWMEQYSWLVYSDVAKGALCKVCVLFGRNYGGRGGQDLRSLVAIPFINWKKLNKYLIVIVGQTIIFFRLKKLKVLSQL